MTFLEFNQLMFPLFSYGSTVAASDCARIKAEQTLLKLVAFIDITGIVYVCKYIDILVYTR